MGSVNSSQDAPQVAHKDPVQAQKPCENIVDIQDEQVEEISNRKVQKTYIDIGILVNIRDWKVKDIIQKYIVDCEISKEYEDNRNMRIGIFYHTVETYLYHDNKGVINVEYSASHKEIPRCYRKTLEEKGDYQTWDDEMKDPNFIIVSQHYRGGGVSTETVANLALDELFPEKETSYYKIVNGMINFKPQYKKNMALTKYEEKIKASKQLAASKNEDGLNSEEKNHLNLYTTSSFKKINLKLLSGTSKYDPQIHQINRAIINSLQFDLPDICYRVAQYEAYEFEACQVGRMTYTSAFTSASRTVLRNWKGNTLMVILLERGKRVYACDVRKYSAYPQEYEIVFALNSPMKILYKSESTEGYKYVIVLKLLK